MAGTPSNSRGGTGIPETLLDAKGDLIAASAADTAARLAVGTDSYVLQAASAQATGLVWTNIGWTIVTKGSDESLAADTTLQADNELVFTVVSGGQYEFEIILIYASPAGAGTPDLKTAFGEDATARGWGAQGGYGASDTASSGVALANQTSTLLFGTAAADRIARIVGIYTGAGGTFALLWAQNTSNANPTIVRAGSFLRYRRVL